MSNNQLAHGNIADDDDVIIIEEDTEPANNDPQSPEIIEVIDDEIEVLSANIVKPRRNTQLERPQLTPSAPNRQTQQNPIFVDLSSDEEPEEERMEVEEEDDSDVEDVNIDTSSTESMLSFIMDDNAPNAASSSQVGPSTQPSTSQAALAASTSKNPVRVSQMNNNPADDPIAPTPAKRRCVRRTETVQNERNLPRISLGSQPVDASSSSAPVVLVNSPFTSAPKPATSVQRPPRRSVRIVDVAKKPDNKENVPSTSEPGSSSSKPAAKSVAIGAALLGDEEQNRCFYFPRTPAVPIGLKRLPFNGELPKEVRKKCEYSKIIRKLKIQKDENFPESTREGRMIASVLGEKNTITTYPGDPSQNDPEGAAVLEKYLGDEPGQDYKDMDDKEELVWSAEKLENGLEGHKKAIEEFYKGIEDKYLFAVWRQFESRIPLEYALQNLQKENYSIVAALGSIGEYLKRLPQKMKDPSAAQTQYLATEFEDNKENVDLSWCQDNVMRNFHMAEIHCFYYRFRKFFDLKEDGKGLDLRVGCNCRQQKCRPLSYEPRYGCSNCTNKLRKHKLPAQKLCLLCSTQLDISGVSKPVENVVLDADDLEKIKKWDTEVAGSSRAEFEAWNQEQKNGRYKKLQLTQEEILMLDFEKLTVSNLAEQVTAQLQPYVLPHFSRCQCSKSEPVANPPPEISEL